MKEAHRQLRERRRCLLNLAGRTYQELVGRDISYLTVCEMHAFHPVAEAATKLEKLRKMRTIRMEQDVNERELQEELDRTACIFAPVMLLPPPSGNMLVDAEKALEVALYAFKQAQTVFKVITDTKYSLTPRHMPPNRRQKELHRFVLDAEIELLRRQVEVAKWHERYADGDKALRQRRMAQREAKKLARRPSCARNGVGVDIALAVRQKVNVFDIQNMLDQREGS